MPAVSSTRPSAMFWLLLLLADARAEEVATPSSLLGPEHFNHHPFEAGQYLKETQLQPAEPTKQGPVLFPNDAPAPPRPPLIVTSRPLQESVARSELNPDPPENRQSKTDQTVDKYNSIAEPSQLNRVQYKPGYLARVKEYKPFTYDFSTPRYDNYVTPRESYVTPGESYVTPGESYVTPGESYVTPRESYVTPSPITVTGKPVNRFGDYGDYEDGGYEDRYADLVKKNRLIAAFGRDNRYDDDEAKTALPPIYKALADYAKQNVLNVKQKNAEVKQRNYKKTKEPVYSNAYQHNHVDEDDRDYTQNSNYAFSYIVKDKNTGDDFSHSQQSSGSATNGEYRVRLPDGRMQIVSYTADENGYKADVRYDDEDKTAGNTIDNNYQSQNNVANNHNYQSQNNYVTPSNVPNYQSQNNYATRSNVPNYQSQNNHVSPTNHPNHKYAVPTKETYASNDKYHQNDDYANPNSNVDYAQINNQFYDQQRKVNERVIQQQEYQKAALKDEYFNQYGDTANDYENNDYSLEYNGKNDNYQPHSSKFTQLAESKLNQKQNVGVIFVPNNLDDSTPKPSLKPSYEELNNLFVHKQPIPSAQNYLYNNIPIELNVPSTTPRPNDYETTTEHVVIIGTTKPNLYTNVRNSIPTLSPSSIYDGLSTPSSFAVTPKNIDFSGPKPRLSSSFIDRINRYLSY